MASVIDLANGKQVHDRRARRTCRPRPAGPGRSGRSARCSTPPRGPAAPTASPRSTSAPAEVHGGLVHAGPRHGFNDARITSAGTSVLTFDDQRPFLPHRRGGDRHRAHPVPRRDGVQGLGRRAARRWRGLVGGAAARTRSRPPSSSPGSATGTSTSAPARPAAWSRAAGSGLLRARAGSATATRPGSSDGRPGGGEISRSCTRRPARAAGGLLSSPRCGGRHDHRDRG